MKTTFSIARDCVGLQLVITTDNDFSTSQFMHRLSMSEARKMRDELDETLRVLNRVG